MKFLASLLAVAVFGCGTLKPANTAAFVQARSEAESASSLIKHNFKQHELEFVKTEFLYGEVKADYDCILEAFMSAVSSGKDPNDERNFAACARSGQQHRRDFVDFVQEALTKPRA